MAEKILVTSGTVTYVIDKLERRGLVGRKRCDKDKRVFYVQLTEDGAKLMENIFPIHEAYLESLLGGLPEKSKQQLIENLILLQTTIDPTKVII